MRLYEFFNVINIRVKYRITDRVTKRKYKKHQFMIKIH